MLAPGVLLRVGSSPTYIAVPHLMNQSSPCQLCQQPYITAPKLLSLSSIVASMLDAVGKSVYVVAASMAGAMHLHTANSLD